MTEETKEAEQFAKYACFCKLKECVPKDIMGDSKLDILRIEALAMALVGEHAAMALLLSHSWRHLMRLSTSLVTSLQCS